MATVDLYRTPKRKPTDLPMVQPGPMDHQPLSPVTKLPQTRNPLASPNTFQAMDRTPPQPIPPNLGSGAPGGQVINDGPTHGEPSPIGGPVAPPPAQTGGQGFGAAGRGEDVGSYIQKWQKNWNLPPTAASLDSLIASLRAEGWVNAKRADHNGQPSNDKIDLGNGQGADVIFSEGMPNAAWAWQPYSTGGSGGGGGTGDPSSELFINEVLSRIGALHQPVNDPLAPLYQLMAMQRIQGLQGAPYTAGEDAAMTARYMNPLTTARDAELQANKERIGARGMLPTSGLLDELNKGTNANYQTGVALGSNDLAVRAVDEKQRRQDEALDVLSKVLGFNKGQRTEEDQRGQSIIDLAGMLPAMDERRLALLNQSATDNSAAQGVNGLLQQQSTALQQKLLHANTQAQRDAAWGEFFGTLLNNWGSLFG